MGVVVLSFFQFRIPGHGFTYLLDFGETIGLPLLPEVASLPVYVHKDVPGYDAQFYSQLAVEVDVGREGLRQYIDSLPYRGRRILMGWIAWGLGLGDPWRVLNIFACLNLVTWVALAFVLTRWFPPRGAGELLRWAGVLFSTGALASLRHALIDGPALLILVLTVWLIELRRPWAAVACGALAPITRETCLIVVAAFAPDRWRDWRRWPVAVARGWVVVLPLAVWIGWLLRETGGELSDGAGHRNFNLPFVSYGIRWVEILRPLFTGGSFPDYAQYAFLGHTALTVQAAFVLLRPRWSSVWWRLAAAHVALMAVLGDAVWEGFPGAAFRVLLPLQLCFNVLVPGTRWGTILLIAGNLSIFAGVAEMYPPPRQAIRTTTASAGFEKIAPPHPSLMINDLQEDGGDLRLR